MKILGVIPARYASTRFPGKPLAMINGKSMIRRVYEQAVKSSSLSNVLVATDDSRIFDHVTAFGGNVMMTSAEHQNGTARCQEVLNKISQDTLSDKYDAVINIQGDEPYIDPAQIDMVSTLFENPQTNIGTLVKKINTTIDLFDKNIVKVVFNKDNNALYFSRQPIPFLRGAPKDEWLQQHTYFKHIGIYGYRADILNKIILLKETELETAEKLEQLRWLENTYSIAIDITDIESLAVDTPDDLLKLNNRR